MSVIFIHSFSKREAKCCTDVEEREIFVEIPDVVCIPFATIKQILCSFLVGAGVAAKEGKCM